MDAPFGNSKRCRCGNPERNAARVVSVNDIDASSTMDKNVKNFKPVMQLIVEGETTVLASFIAFSSAR